MQNNTLRYRSLLIFTLYGTLCISAYTHANTSFFNHLNNTYLGITDTAILTTMLALNCVHKHSETIKSLWKGPNKHTDIVNFFKDTAQRGDIQLADPNVEQWIFTQMQEWHITEEHTCKRQVVIYTFIRLAQQKSSEINASVQKIGTVYHENSAHQDVIILRISPHVHDVIKQEMETSHPDIEMVKAILQHALAHVAYDHLRIMGTFHCFDFFAQLCAIAFLASRRHSALSGLVAYLAAGIGLPLLRSFISKRMAEQADDCIETEIGGRALFALWQEEIEDHYARLPRVLQYILPKEVYSYLINPHHPPPKARLARLNARFT